LRVDEDVTGADSGLVGHNSKRKKRSSSRVQCRSGQATNINREVSKVGGFIIACRLYLRMRMRETIVEEQI